MPRNPPVWTANESLANAEPETRTTAKKRFWRRRRFWAWAFLGFVTSVVFAVALLPSTRTLVQFHRVKKGMTPQEVFSLLGAPISQSGGRNALDDEAFDGYVHWSAGEMSYTVRFRAGDSDYKAMHSFEKGLRWILGSRMSRNLF